jgi:hypothetical protein
VCSVRHGRALAGISGLELTRPIPAAGATLPSAGYLAAQRSDPTAARDVALSLRENCFDVRDPPFGTADGSWLTIIPGHTDQIDLCAGVVRIWPMSEHL